MAKNKRDWSEINARKGKRYVPKNEEKKNKPTGRPAKPAAKPERRHEEQFFDQEPAANVVIGRNPVMEALKNDREIEKILIGKGAEGSVTKIVGWQRTRAFRYTRVTS